MKKYLLLMCARRKAVPQNQEKAPFCLCNGILALLANINGFFSFTTFMAQAFYFKQTSLSSVMLNVH